MVLDIFFDKSLNGIPLYLLSDYLKEATIVQMNNSILAKRGAERKKFECIYKYYRDKDNEIVKAVKNNTLCYNVKRSFGLSTNRINNCEECHSTVSKMGLELIK